MSSSNDPWNSEQVPFESAAEAAATAEASTAAGVVGEPPISSDARSKGPTAGAGAYATAGTGVPPASGWAPMGGAYAPPAAYPPPAAIVSGPPNPVLAFFLGLIPGVGAMYNGQIPKGFVHLIVFAVLVTLANNVSDIFGIFVAGWIFFQAFEAYHTAKARRDGLLLPNAFGWNDIGERMGLGKNWPFSPGTPASAPVAPGPAAGSGATGPAANPAEWAGVPPLPPFAPIPPISPAGSGSYAGAGPAWGSGVAPNWAGYVPPTAFASAPPVGAAGVGAVPPGQGVPYAPVNTGGPYQPFSPADLPPAPSRLPVGAMWLIGLGVLFLLGQWSPLLHWSHVWVPSVVLAGLAALLFARRMGWTGAMQPAAALPIELRVAGAIRVPGILLAIAILNGLHEAWIVRWHSSWPCLLIVIGVLMLVERVALRRAAPVTFGPDPTLNSVPADPTTQKGARS